MKRLLLILPGVLLVAGAWTLKPSPIDAASWQPPPKPEMTGPWAPNEKLEQASLLGQGQISGPEAVAVDAEGRVFAGTGDGWIVKVRGDQVERWVETGGRPLGMAFDGAGRLIVADAWKGLLAVTPDGEVETLATEADGVPFRFTDDLDIASDGTIYFSDASSRFPQPHYRLDIMAARPHGRLLKYEPESGAVSVLVPELHFANGVALDADERSVLVNETGRYRVMRYWLEGERAGTLEVFIDNLPGFPDNISRDRQGRFWLALPTLRVDSLDLAHPYPWLKEQMAKLPASLQPQPVQYGLVAVLSPEGKVLASLHDTDGSHLQEITSVEPVGDTLYLGSLHNDRIGRLNASEVLSGPEGLAHLSD